jgi:predicted SAM-dependent methyltransferase
MCHGSCISFLSRSINLAEIQNRRILEIGSLDDTQIGTDIFKGRNVDVVCGVSSIVEKFGKESFDIVISTEVLEHVKEWKAAINNIKNVLKCNGIAIITTRSKGYNYHPTPEDHWRYEIQDIKEIFSDCQILKIEKDWPRAGVFVKVKKPADFKENDLTQLNLFHILFNKRIAIAETNCTLKKILKDIIKRVFQGLHEVLNRFENICFRLGSNTIISKINAKKKKENLI